MPHSINPLTLPDRSDERIGHLLSGLPDSVRRNLLARRLIHLPPEDVDGGAVRLAAGAVDQFAGVGSVWQLHARRDATVEGEHARRDDEAYW